MAKKTRDQVVDEVTNWINEVLRVNRRQEWVLITVLLLILAVGLGLIIYGSILQVWKLIVPGGVFAMMVTLPVTKLMELRSCNLRIQLIPQLTRLATTADAQALVVTLIKDLLATQMGKGKFRMSASSGARIVHKQRSYDESEALANVLNILESGEWKQTS
jgi:hypothetical protein